MGSSSTKSSMEKWWRSRKWVPWSRFWPPCCRVGWHLIADENRLGRVVSETLFLLDASRGLKRRPDLAFVSVERWPRGRRVPRAECWEVVPDLAVEFVSLTNSADQVLEKVEEYFRSSVRLVWVVYPSTNKVYVYDSPTSVRILQVGDDLDGGTVLPGFRLALAELFQLEAEQDETST